MLNGKRGQEQHSCSLGQLSLVAQSCSTLCDPMDYRMPGFPVHHQLLKPAQIHVHRVGDATQPSHPVICPLLLPSVFPSIKVFSKKSVLSNRWPKYWNFSFSISPSVISDSLQPRGLQHARLPCSSPTPRACSNSRPSSR